MIFPRTQVRVIDPNLLDFEPLENLHNFQGLFAEPLCLQGSQQLLPVLYLQHPEDVKELDQGWRPVKPI